MYRARVFVSSETILVSRPRLRDPLYLSLSPHLSLHPPSEYPSSPFSYQPLKPRSARRVSARDLRDDLNIYKARSLTLPPLRGEV